MMQPNKRDATNVIITGGCYCKAVRYECRGPLSFRALCYCRTCQMISGGAGNLFTAVDAQTFQFTSGSPRSFTNNEHPWRPTRHFCENCGVHLTARSERAPSAVLIKVGTLDEPAYPELPSPPARKENAQEAGGRPGPT